MKILWLCVLVAVIAAVIAVINAATATADPFNSRLAFNVGSDGRFNMGAFPNPATGGSTAGSWDLMYRWPSEPWSSFTTVRIDGSDYVYGSSGTQVQAPTDIDANTNISKWQIGDVLVTQTLQIINNPATGEMDTGVISYSYTNTGNVPHSVGLRVMIDTEINYNDGAPYRVPGVGAITTETDFLDSAVPDDFQVFYSLSDSEHVMGVLLGDDPDRLVIARWPSIQVTNWDYTPTGASITLDSAFAVYWNPATLSAAATVTHTTGNGLSEFDVDLTPPLALGLSGAASLSEANGQYSPNPFNVTATISNTGVVTATAVEATLNLPTGLSLASGTATQSIGNLAAGAETSVAWSVLAAARATPATLTYSVTVDATNSDPKTVNRDIFVPAMPMNISTHRCGQM